MRFMEVQFPPDLEEDLVTVADQTGVPADQLVRQVMSGYLEHVRELREEIDSRYDELKSGRVELIDGETARRLLLAKTDSLHRQRQ